MTVQLPLFISGEFVQRGSSNKRSVINPANQQLLAEVLMATLNSKDVIYTLDLTGIGEKFFTALEKHSPQWKNP